MHDTPRKLRVELADASISPIAREVWRDGVDLAILAAKLRDRGAMLARIAVCGALLLGLVAIIYVRLHNAPYSATTELLISNTTLQVSGQDAAVTQIMVDNSLIESEIELLKSGAVLGRVVDAIGLDAIESALPPPSIALPFPLQSLLHPPQPTPEDGDAEALAARRRAVIAALRASLTVKRLGASQIVSIRASSATADGAVILADEVARAFVTEEEVSNRLVTTSAAFRERIKVLGAAARVVTNAVPPIAKDGPGRLVILAVALLAGGLGGFAFAFALILCDRRVTTREQLSFLGSAEFLGCAPRLEAPTLRSPGWPLSSLLRPRGTTRAHSPARWAHENFDPVLRRASLAAQERFGRAPRVIAVTSCSPGEGVTTMASSFARLLASQNRRVILIDANEQKPDLSSNLAPDATVGLRQVLGGGVSRQEAVWTDVENNLEFLPLGSREENAETCWSEMLRLVGDSADPDAWIILDMPPIEEGVAVRSAADAIDGLLLVVAKGRTSQTSIEECQRLLGPARHKLFGVVINDAPKPRRQRAAWGVDLRREAGVRSEQAELIDEESNRAQFAETTTEDRTPAWEER